MISNETKKLLSMIITVGVIARTGLFLNDRSKTFTDLGTMGVAIPTQKDEKFNAKTIYGVVSKKTEQFKTIKKENLPEIESGSILDSKFIPAPVKPIDSPPIPLSTGNIPIPPEPTKINESEEMQRKQIEQKQQEEKTTLQQTFAKSIQIEGILNQKLVINGVGYQKGETMKELSQKFMIGGKEEEIIPKLLNFDTKKASFEFGGQTLELTFGATYE